MAQEINDDQFNQEVLESAIPVLVDFWAPWCGPCKMMGPVVEEIASEIDSSKCKVVKVNIDDNKEYAEKHGVMSIPTFLIFKNGEVADQVVGGVGKEKLMEMVHKHIA